MQLSARNQLTAKVDSVNQGDAGEAVAVGRRAWLWARTSPGSGEIRAQTATIPPLDTAAGHRRWTPPLDTA